MWRIKILNIGDLYLIRAIRVYSVSSTKANGVVHAGDRRVKANIH